MAKDELPIAFQDLPPHLFPFSVEAIDMLGQVVWSATIEGPGVLQVPGLIKEHGPVSMRTTFPDGTSYLAPPRL